MTDKEKFKALLDSFGVQYIEYDDFIHLMVGYSKVEGYASFMCDYEFDENGQFIKIDICE